MSLLSLTVRFESALIFPLGLSSPQLHHQPPHQQELRLLPEGARQLGACVPLISPSLLFTSLSDLDTFFSDEMLLFLLAVVGLVQAQDPANNPNLFFDPLDKAQITKGERPNVRCFFFAMLAFAFALEAFR